MIAPIWGTSEQITSLYGSTKSWFKMGWTAFPNGCNWQHISNKLAATARRTTKWGSDATARSVFMLATNSSAPMNGIMAALLTAQACRTSAYISSFGPESVWAITSGICKPIENNQIDFFKMKSIKISTHHLLTNVVFQLQTNIPKNVNLN